ncbi:hypothetical protein G9A89_001316 [Geosiphon pyriformis]|nr:hypothetical protein G9A89_001316 [Geosiphon pyriformis]
MAVANKIFTEDELLKTNLPTITYTHNSKYDSFSHGKHYHPESIQNWPNFFEEVKQYQLDNTNYLYSLPIPETQPIDEKDDLRIAIETQIFNVVLSIKRWHPFELRPLVDTSNMYIPSPTISSSVNNVRSPVLAASDTSALTPLSNPPTTTPPPNPIMPPITSSSTSPIDWNFCNKDGKLLLPIALRSKWTLPCDSHQRKIYYFKSKLDDFGCHSIQVYDYMLQHGYQYGILSTYECTWFFKRPKENPRTFLASYCIKYTDKEPTVLQAVNYIYHLAENDPYAPNWSQSNITSSTQSINPSLTKLGTPLATTNRIKDQTSGDSIVSTTKKINPEITLVWDQIEWTQDAGVGRNGRVYHIYYCKKHLALKYRQQNYDPTVINLRHEVRVYKQLQPLQGCFIPPLVLYGPCSNDIMFCICTSYIHPLENVKLSRRHKEVAMNAIRAIHNLRVLHNDIRIENFILGNDPYNSERLYIINFNSAKIESRDYEITDEMRERELDQVKVLFDSLED